LALREFRLGVSDGGFECHHVVAFGFADGAGDGSRYGRLYLPGRGVGVGDDQSGAPDGDGGSGLFFELRGSFVVGEFACACSDEGADRGSGE
jgi:hypothetical protein